MFHLKCNTVSSFVLMLTFYLQKLNIFRFIITGFKQVFTTL